ncbi:MAG: DUF2442 domain-containing protein, partial [Spirochaetales bacterium]|nr:DUF2442 domain-containing protein [Candidatus Physcosoma equi]
MAARYYAEGRKKIVAVLANDDFTLSLTFDNGEDRLLDVKPMIKPKTVFAFLSSLDNFKRVYLDEQSCVSWDVDPSIDSTLN